jgi:hypothetical protein
MTPTTEIPQQDQAALVRAQSEMARVQADRQQLANERDLALAQISPEYASILAQEKRFQTLQRYAELMATSGMFEEKVRVKNGDDWDDVVISGNQAVARVAVRIMLGDSMGFSAVESMQAIHIIENQPSISAAARAARVEMKYGFGWDIDWHERDGVCVGCSLHLKHISNNKPLLDPSGNPVVVSFLESDAKKLKTKIWEYDKILKKRVPREGSALDKDNWKNTPRNMYFSRAVSNAQRWYAPAALNGAPIPSREEAMDATYEDLTNEPEAPKKLQEPRRMATAAPQAETKQPEVETKQPKPETEPAAPEMQEPAKETPTDPNARIDTKQATAIRNAFLNQGWNQRASLEVLKSFGAKAVMDVRADKFEAIMAELTKGDSQ